MVQLELSMYWDSEVGVDVENIHRYTTGGFHPICLGDVLSSTKAEYRVLHKLGRGSFSTVWLAEALQEPCRYVALKICVAQADPKHELEIFNRLLRTPPAPPNVLQLQDHFSLRGPNGVHTVLVFNVLGSLLSIIRSPNRPGLDRMRKLCREITVGLTALHRQGIVHGDLHAGNVGISLPSLNSHSPRDILDHFGNPECMIVLPTTRPAHPGSLPPYLVPAISVVDYLIANNENPFEGPFRAEITDLGNAIVVNDRVRPACTPATVCAPELMFERIACPVDPASPPTQASDIWSLACMIYELVSGMRLFPFPLPNTLLSRMATLCGEVPQEWTVNLVSREQLHSLSVLHSTADAQWNRILETFTKGGRHREGDVKQLFTLLRSMLVIDPTRRPSAEEVLKHPWFSHGETA